MEKNKGISALILRLEAEGMDFKTAFNAVLGANAFEQLASDLYDEFNK